jgi:hypothetical protein
MATTDIANHHSSHQAFQILRLGFTIAPILAGLDKFFNLLTNWEQYLAPFVTQTLGINATTFMMAVGVIEIVAGLLVWFKPRFGGYLVMAWLWGIIINLLLIPGYFDVALRDFGLSLGAMALARLAEAEVPAHAAERMREAHV